MIQHIYQWGESTPFHSFERWASLTSGNGIRNENVHGYFTLYKLVAFHVQHRNKYNSVRACVSIKIIIQLSVLMYSGKSFTTSGPLFLVL